MTAFALTEARRQSWLFASFYGIYFAAMGAWVPYWTLYLKQQGLSVAAVGALVGFSTLTAVVSVEFLSVKGLHWVLLMF